MAAEYAYRRTDTDPVHEPVLAPVCNISTIPFSAPQPLAHYSTLSEHENLLNDSGCYDTSHTEQFKYDVVYELAEWQDHIVRLWHDHNRRVASDFEIALFCGILLAPEESIKHRLRYLVEQDEQFSQTSCHDNTVGISDRYILGKDMHNSQDSGIALSMDTMTSQPSLAAQANLSDSSNFYEDVSLSIQTRHSSNERPTIFSTNLDDKHTILNAHQQPAITFSHSVFLSVADSTPKLSQLDTEMSTSGSYSLEICGDSTERINLPHGSVENTFLSSNAAYNVQYQRTDALLKLINKVIRTRNAKGCGLIRSHESQSGRYPCTLGCGRRFRSSCDLFRHEQIVYPQQFWFCFHCGDAEHPSERHLFTRDDKMSQHTKHFHPENFSISRCRIPDIQTSFPLKCQLCLHHRHRNWKDRCKHVISHCKKGEYSSTIGNQNLVGREENHVNIFDDNDDDDDDDDNDGGDDGQNDDDPNQAKEDDTEPDPSNGDAAHDYDNRGPGSQDENDQFNHDDDTNDFLGMCNWVSPDFWRFPTSVSINHFSVGSKPEDSAPRPRQVAIKWLEKVNQKGGTASVFKVALSVDLARGNHGQRTIYAVKQYPSKNRALYERETEAFRNLNAQGQELAHIIHFYATFESHNSSGQMTHNIILEYGDCDLREYWADNSRPRTTDAILKHWKCIFDILHGIEKLHDGYGVGVDHILRGVHGDIKPDNIVLVGGAFKLADFGFADLSTGGGKKVHGGTATYSTNPRSCAPIIQLLTRYSRP